MDDGQLQRYFAAACMVWAKSHGDSAPVLGSLRFKYLGGSTYDITTWPSSAPQPTVEDLRAISTADCDAYIGMVQLLSFMTPDYTVATATQDQIDAVDSPPQGAIVINSTASCFQVYIDGAWVSVTPPGATVVYPVELVAHPSQPQPAAAAPPRGFMSPVARSVAARPAA